MTGFQIGLVIVPTFLYIVVCFVYLSIYTKMRKSPYYQRKVAITKTLMIMYKKTGKKRNEVLFSLGGITYSFTPMIFFYLILTRESSKRYDIFDDDDNHNFERYPDIEIYIAFLQGMGLTREECKEMLGYLKEIKWQESIENINKKKVEE